MTEVVERPVVRRRDLRWSPAVAAHDPVAAHDVVSPATGSSGARHTLLALILCIVLTQRIGVPLGGGEQLPLTLPMAMLIAFVGIYRGWLILDRARTRFYALAIGTLVVLSLVAHVRGHDLSLLSIGFAVTLYAFVTLTAPTLTGADVGWLLDAFVRLMVIAAIIGLIQMGVQYAGVPYGDLLTLLLPPEVVITGYNTGDAIMWDSSIYRVNGVLFLEPSFFSYFLGLAAVVALYRGRSAVSVGVLIVAIVPTLAGNGIVVLATGIVALVISPRRRHLRALALPAVAAVALALSTPVADRFLSRVTEVESDGSSSSLRLVQPYERLLPAWLPDPWGVALGNGPGSATELLGSDRITGLIVPIVPKLLLEYGVVGAAVFGCFLVWSLLHGRAQPPWALGLLISYAVLNAAFLQVTLALSTIVFLCLLPIGDSPPGSDPRRLAPETG